MEVSLFIDYIYDAFPAFPGWHWAVMVIIALGVVFGLFYLKRTTFYRGMVVGLTLFYGLFLLDALVIARLGKPISFDPSLNLVDEYQRLVNGNHAFWIYSFFNVLAFIPFGFLIYEAFSSQGNKRNWGITVLLTFGLSLLVESLQWIMHVGFFEVTDMLLNTLGGAIGGALMLRMMTQAKV